MTLHVSMENWILATCLLVFSAGLSCIFLRRLALWCVVGQVIALKAVIAAGFITSTMHDPGHADLVFVSLILLGLVPQACLVGMVVVHRCSRFGGSLDMAKQGNLRH